MGGEQRKKIKIESNEGRQRNQEGSTWTERSSTAAHEYDWRGNMGDLILKRNGEWGWGLPYLGGDEKKGRCDEPMYASVQRLALLHTPQERGGKNEKKPKTGT